MKLIREFRPQVVTTYDENGGYPHPDHVMCHQITVAAFEAAGDQDAYPELGEPWQPLKLYYHHTFHYERMKALHDAMIARGLESPYADRLKDWKPDPENERRITTRVECARVLRGPGQGAARARHPDRPGRRVVRRTAGGAPGGLADRGLRAGAESGRVRAARERPVRGAALTGAADSERMVA